MIKIGWIQIRVQAKAKFEIGNLTDTENLTSYNITCIEKKNTLRATPADMRCLWDVSIRSPLSSKTSQKHLKSDVFKTPQIHLKKDVFFATILRRLKYISKKMFFVWGLYGVSNISQKGCLLFCDVSDTSQKYILEVFVAIQKYPTEMVSCW